MSHIPFKMYPLWVNLGFLLFLRTVDGLFHVTDKKFSLIYEDYKGPPPYTILTADDVLSCNVLCEDNQHCLTFAFHSDTRECYVYERLLIPSELESELGTRVYQVKGDNIAYQKSVTGSSISGASRSSKSVVDGNVALDQYYQTGAGDFNPYIVIDLSVTYEVIYVNIYNSNTNPELLHDVNIDLYNEDPLSDPMADAACCGSIPGVLPSGPTQIMCQDWVRGRYVKLFMENSEKMTICEVEVVGNRVATGTDEDSCEPLNCTRPKSGGGIVIGGEDGNGDGGNIALHQPTSESSSLQSSPYDSYVLVDGINSVENYFSTGDGDTSPWIQIDLGSAYNVRSVVIFNYKDVNMLDTKITVYYSDPDMNSICKYIPGNFGIGVKTVECENDMTAGRYVRITKDGLYLQLSEVRVTGVLLPG